MYNEATLSCSMISDELAPTAARAQTAAMAKAHLNLDERIELEAALRAGDTQATVAVRLMRRPERSVGRWRSTQNFYPDFVCLLTDGRVLAVEFKGAHLVTADDAKEKAAVGAVWESRSGGHCLFVMPTSGKLDEIKTKIATK